MIRPAHCKVCVSKKVGKVRNLMVLDFTRELSVKLFRYSAHFLHFYPFGRYCYFNLFVTLLNHFVSSNLMFVNRTQPQTNSFVSVFHLWCSKYLVKSVYLEGLLGYLVGLKERVRLVWLIYHLFGLLQYLREI